MAGQASSTRREAPSAARSDDNDLVRQAHRLVSDLFPRSPLIYWTDFMLSVSGAWLLTAVYFLAPAWSVLQIAAFLVAGVLFYRAGTFMHEMVHMQRQELKWFKRTWNVLLGMPLLTPWIFYRNHIDHHNRMHFGTPRDGEYTPLAASPVRETLKYLLQAPLLPIFAVLRFGVIAPLSHLHPRLREFVLTRLSAGATNPYYSKRFPKRDEGHLTIMEWLCFAWIAAIATLLVLGYITAMHLLMAYLLLGWTLTLNWVRNMAAHGYANDGQPLTHADQLRDSINITGQTWITAWLFPIGLRYHALHHLLPGLPYHNMGEAHRRLSENLPADSVYHEANRESFFAAVAELWRGACNTPPEQSAMEYWRRFGAGGS